MGWKPYTNIHFSNFQLNSFLGHFTWIPPKIQHICCIVGSFELIDEILRHINAHCVLVHVKSLTLLRPVAVADGEDYAKQIVQKLNLHRASHGLPLIWNHTRSIITKYVDENRVIDVFSKNPQKELTMEKNGSEDRFANRSKKSKDMNGGVPTELDADRLNSSTLNLKAIKSRVDNLFQSVLGGSHETGKSVVREIILTTQANDGEMWLEIGFGKPLLSFIVSELKHSKVFATDTDAIVFKSVKTGCTLSGYQIEGKNIYGADKDIRYYNDLLDTVTNDEGGIEASILQRKNIPDYQVYLMDNYYLSFCKVNIYS